LQGSVVYEDCHPLIATRRRRRGCSRRRERKKKVATIDRKPKAKNIKKKPGLVYKRARYLPKFSTYGNLPAQSSYNSLSLGSKVDSMVGSTRNLIFPAPTLAGTVINNAWVRELRKGKGENVGVMTGVVARGVARVEAEGAS